MNDGATGHEHELVWELLPMLAIGRLTDAERARVEQHLARCPDCQRELALEQRVAAAVRAEPAPHRSPEPGLARLLAQINAPALPVERTPPRRSPSWWQRLRAELSDTLQQPAFRPALAGFALVALIGSGWLLLPSSALAPPAVRLAGNDSTGFRVLAATPADALPADRRSMLKLVFAPSTPGERQRELLALVQGRIVGEANSVGAYTVQLAMTADAGSVAERIARLRREPDVLLAEPLQLQAAP